LDDFVLDGQSIFVKLFDLIHQGYRRSLGVEFIDQLRRLVLQKVHLAEQVDFLLGFQEWDLVQGCQIGRQSAGCSQLARRRDGVGSIGQNLVDCRVVFELWAGDKIQSKFPDSHRPLFVEDSDDAAAGASVPFGQHDRRKASEVLLVEGSFVLFGEHIALFWENSHGRIFPVEILDGVSNGLDASVHIAGNLTNDFGKVVALAGQSASPVDDLIAFGIGHLAEAFAPLDAEFVLMNEPLDARVQEPDPLAPLGDEPAGNQTLISPSGNGLGRNVEPFAQILDGVDRFGGFFETQVHRVGDVFDEEAKVMDGILSFDQSHRVGIGTDLGHPIEQEIEWVVLRRIQFRQKLLSAVGLLAPFVPRGKTNLLIPQFPNQNNLVVAIHLVLASCHANIARFGNSTDFAMSA
jgi:hypothetical protein